MRTVLIGDVHGCCGALDALLARLAPDPEADRIILLGDLFDRGKESYEVFQAVQKLAAAFGGRFVLLRGNHEDYLLQPHLALPQRIVWERVGRSATVKSFKAHGAQMEDAIPWLKEHCRLYWKGDGIQCVHAGLKVDPPEANDFQTLVMDHDTVRQNRYAGPLTVTGHIALEAPTWFKGDGKNVEKLPLGEWKALPAAGVICIDTGCGKGGKLTGMTVEDGKYMLLSV